MASVTKKLKGEPRPDHAVSVTISMPYSLYEQMLRRARDLKMGRSAYVQQLLEADK